MMLILVFTGSEGKRPYCAVFTFAVPGLIIVNGHGGDKYSWYAFYSGILYAQAGAAVRTYDPAGEGERNIDRKVLVQSLRKRSALR